MIASCHTDSYNVVSSNAFFQTNNDNMNMSLISLVRFVSIPNVLITILKKLTENFIVHVCNLEQ